MQQRDGQLALHPLAQRELPRRLAQERRQVQKLGELGHGRVVLLAGNIVDGAVEQERFGRRQVPEKLLLLSHHQRDLLEEPAGALPGDEARHRDPTFGGMQEPGQHFQSCRLPRAVRSEKADALAGGDGEGNVFDRLHVLVGAMEQRAESRRQPGSPPVDAVPLAQAIDFDHGRTS